VPKYYFPRSSNTLYSTLCDPSDVDALQESLSVCIDEVFFWMMSNRLQLNSSKTEVLWCSSVWRQYQILTGPVCVGDTSVLPVRTVRDLVVYIDADVTVSAHMAAIVKVCFATLRQIRSVRRSLTDITLLTLVHALVVTKVDYCSSVLCYNRLSRVLRKEVGAHNSTPVWTTLAEISGENSVPVMLSHISLTYRRGAVIPQIQVAAKIRVLPSGTFS